MLIYLKLVRDILRGDYGSVPPSPRYTRTYSIYNNWHIYVSPDGSEGTLVNTTPWAVYVQGPRNVGGRGIGERQTAVMRARGWQSITDVARQTRPAFKQLLNRSISPHAGEEG